MQRFTELASLLEKIDYCGLSLGVLERSPFFAKGLFERDRDALFSRDELLLGGSLLLEEDDSRTPRGEPLRLRERDGDERLRLRRGDRERERVRERRLRYPPLRAFLSSIGLSYLAIATRTSRPSNHRPSILSIAYSASLRL